MLQTLEEVTDLYYISMIKLYDRKDYSLINIKPNNSSTLNENIIFFGFLGLLCLTFGIGFFFIGATLILPFAGIEIIALIFVLRLNRNWSSQWQKIKIDKLFVEIEEQKRKKTKDKFDRFLSKFIVENKNGRKIYFINKNTKIELGSFLTEEEKDKLINFLEKKVQQFNFS